MTEQEELKRLAVLANEAGDTETELAALRKLDALDSSEKPLSEKFVDSLKDAGNVALDVLNPMNAPGNARAIIGGLGHGTNRVIAGIGDIVAGYNEKMGVLPPGAREEYNKGFNQDQQSMRDFASPGNSYQRALFQGSDVVGNTAIPAAIGGPMNLVGRSVVGGTWGALDYTSADSSLSRTEKALVGTFGAAVAPPIMKGVAHSVNFGKGAAESAWRKITGKPDAVVPLAEGLAPITRSLTGVSDALSGKPNRQTVTLAEFDDASREARRLFGKDIEAPLSSQLGSVKASGAEGAVTTNAMFADRALNEKARIVERAFGIADEAATGLRTGKVSEVRAGKMLAAAQRNAQEAALSLAERQYNVDIAPVKTALGKTKVIGNDNQVRVLREIVDENLGNIKDIEGNAARLLKRFSHDGNLDVDGFILRRSLFSRYSNKGGLLGIQNPEMAKQAAHKMKMAAEADFAAAVDKYVIDDGVKGAFQTATKNYAVNMTKLGDLENSVFGKLLGKDPTTFTEFAQKAQRMTPEQWRISMNALRKVSPNIDKRMGRFIMDEAKKAAELKVGPKAMASEAQLDPGEYWKFLKENEKFISTFPEKSRGQVKVIMDNMNRIADKASSSTAGGSSTAQGAAEGIVMASASMSPPFVIKQLVRFGYGPSMLYSLYTEEGRRMLMNVTKGVLDGVNPVLYQRSLDSLIGKFKENDNEIEIKAQE